MKVEATAILFLKPGARPTGLDLAVFRKGIIPASLNDARIIPGAFAVAQKIKISPAIELLKIKHFSFSSDYALFDQIPVPVGAFTP